MNVPKLRFKEFDGEWRSSKLGEVAEVKDSARISNEYWVENGIPYLRSSDLVNDDLKGELFISQETYDRYASKTGAPEKDDLLFTSGGKIGVVYHKEDNSLVYVQGGAVLYVKTSNSKSLEGTFLSTYFSTHKMKRYIENASAGGTIKHFTLKPANAAPITFPNNDEQIKIGTFFKKLDKKIQLQQQKIDLLQEQKKGFLQKMFPKACETQPEMRFDGFTDKWKEHKLGEVSNIIGGGTPNTNTKKYWNGNINWYSPAEIGEEIYVYESRKKITEVGLKKSSARILPVGTILFTSRAGIGNTAILAREGCTNQGFQSIVPLKEKLDSYFIFSRTEELKRYGEINGAGSTFVEVSGKQMSKMPILLPCLEEQKKIGLFFKRLDDEIILQKGKLKLIQQQKQGLMQQMFI